MKAADWRFYSIGIAVFLIVLSLGAFVFGMVLHESSHGIVCRIFGLPYSWSLTKVVYSPSPDYLVNILVGLAGGLFQALFSMSFFWIARYVEEQALKGMVFQTIFTRGRPLIRSVFFGLELALLTIAFHGVINGVWEGLFYPLYERIYDNLLITGTIVFACGVTALFVLLKKWEGLKEAQS